MLQIDVLTLFPELISTPLSQSIMGRAAGKGIIDVRAHQLRDWALDKHRRTDDYLCGGGQGMLLKCEPLFAAIEELRREQALLREQDAEKKREPLRSLDEARANRLNLFSAEQKCDKSC